MGPLVVLTGRQGERRGLGREQRLRFGKEAHRRLPRLARRGEGRHVGQPDREGGAAAALPQARHLLTEPHRRFVEVASGAGNQSKEAQRIDRIDWLVDSIEALHGIAQ